MATEAQLTHSVGDLTLHQTIGGTATCRKLSAAFYARAARDPVLRHFFPGKTQKCAIEEFAAFLTHFLGGPSADAQRRWWLSLHESHLRFEIGHEQRNAWMKNMVQALDDVEMAEPARTAFRDLFERGSAYLVNVGPAPAVASSNTGDAAPDAAHEELTRRWEAQLALDDAVAAIHRGDAARAIELVQGPARQATFQSNRSEFAGVLAAMISTGEPTMLEYVRSELRADPALVRERYAGRTPLHVAAARGNLSIVELLLELGVEPDTADAGGRTALYSVANECSTSGGVDVVRALIHAGADVNTQGGVQRCTPLHMAARRGNVAVARALLECGAAIELADSTGDTPLRRAVNCNKAHVAELLLARGANVHSIGSKGLTPATAARTAAMRSVVRGA